MRRRENKSKEISPWLRTRADSFLHTHSTQYYSYEGTFTLHTSSPLVCVDYFFPSPPPSSSLVRLNRLRSLACLPRSRPQRVLYDRLANRFWGLSLLGR